MGTGIAEDEARRKLAPARGGAILGFETSGQEPNANAEAKALGISMSISRTETVSP